MSCWTETALCFCDSNHLDGPWVAACRDDQLRRRVQPCRFPVTVSWKIRSTGQGTGHCVRHCSLPDVR